MIAILCVLWNWLLLISVGVFVKLLLIDTPLYVLQQFMDISPVLAFSSGENWFILSFAIVMMSALILATPLGEYLLQFLKILRRPLNAESIILEKAEYDVRMGVQKYYNKSIKCRFLISSEILPEHMSLGRGCIVLSKSLLDTTSDEELCAVIAHEIGHLYYADALKWSLCYGANIGSYLVKHGLLGFAFIIEGVVKFSSWFGLLRLGALACHGIIGLIDGMGLLLMRYAQRHDVYRADKFTRNLGFGSYLVSFLEKQAMRDVGEDSLWSHYADAQPHPLQRIERLLQ